MQMFGVGILELLVILLLAVIVVGPDRLPAFAADLARWIRQTRSYARHLMRDFNEVVGELEREAGASREDWKEIASVIAHHTGGVGRELTRVGQQLERTLAAEDRPATPTNVVPIGGGREAEDPQPDGGTSGRDEPAAPKEEKPWYAHERTHRPRASRRRGSE